MTARTLFKGSNIVFILVLLLAYLIGSSLQSDNSTLSKLLATQSSPTPTISVQNDEDIIEEHEPEENASQGGEVAGVATNRQEAQVSKVVDGDTITVSLNGKKETIRIIGLDTPEVVDPRKPIQCFGREASNFAKQTLTGKTVYLESDPSQDDRDKYKRLLRFVFLSDGTDFGKFMIKEGYGHEYTYEMPYTYQKEYKQAEQTARNNKKGLWNETACPSS